jgi:branched-chain amino acid transport system substrate-binding protein
MKSKGVDVAFDTVDVGGNQKICASMDRYGVRVKAKVSTVEVYSQDIGTPAWSAPCRDSIYVGDPATATYADTNVPAVASFRKDFADYGRGFTLHQWAVDGYVSGVFLADAVTDMGANVTRKGFIQWLDAIQPFTYTAHGLITPVDWKPKAHPATHNACFSVAQWQDRVGTYVNRSVSGEYTCYVTKEIGSPYTQDNS